MTGTLTYLEPASLSPDARAIVVLVEGAGGSAAGSIVSNTVIEEPGQVPITFALPFDPDTIDPDATYVVAAEIVDGERKWVTQPGLPVITQGNPTTDVALTLAYLPDVAKGAVTGTITGPAVQLSDSAFSATVLIDQTGGTRVGLDVNETPGQVPIAFSVPFDPAAIDQASSYVVTAAVVDGASRWADPQGVPVITQGQPLSDIEVPVEAIAPVTVPTANGFVLGSIGLWFLLALLIVAWAWYQLRHPQGLQRPAMPAQPPTPIEPAPTSTRGGPPAASRPTTPDQEDRPS